MKYVHKTDKSQSALALDLARPTHSFECDLSFHESSLWLLYTMTFSHLTSGTLPLDPLV